MRSRFSRSARETAWSMALGGLGSIGMRELTGFRVKSPVLSFWKVGGWESTTRAYLCAQKYSCRLLATQVAVAALKTRRHGEVAIGPQRRSRPRRRLLDRSQNCSEVSSERVQLQNNFRVARDSGTIAK